MRKERLGRMAVIVTCSMFALVGLGCDLSTVCPQLKDLLGCDLKAADDPEWVSGGGLGGKLSSDPEWVSGGGTGNHRGP